MEARSYENRSGLLVRVDGPPQTGARVGTAATDRDNLPNTDPGASPVPAPVAAMLREPGWTLALRGIKRAFRQDSRLVFHLFLAIITLTIACVLELSYLEWCLVLAGVGARIGGEFWLGSIRSLGRALAPSAPKQVTAAVELGAAAVSLLMFMSAAIVAVILAHHLLPLLN